MAKKLASGIFAYCSCSQAGSWIVGTVNPVVFAGEGRRPRAGEGRLRVFPVNRLGVPKIDTCFAGVLAGLLEGTITFIGLFGIVVLAGEAKMDVGRCDSAGGGAFSSLKTDVAADAVTLFRFDCPCTVAPTDLRLLVVVLAGEGAKTSFFATSIAVAGDRPFGCDGLSPAIFFGDGEGP